MFINVETEIVSRVRGADRAVVAHYLTDDQGDAMSRSRGHFLNFGTFPNFGMGKARYFKLPSRN